MIFSRVSRLLFNSASTVESRARAVSPSLSLSTSRATAEAASSMALTALCRSRRSRSSMKRYYYSIPRTAPITCVAAPVLLFEAHTLPILGCGAPFFVEDLGCPLLLRVGLFAGLIFLASPVFDVAS